MFELPSKDNPSLADVRVAAMNLLARREHARHELRDKLSRRFGGDGEVVTLINQALDRLVEQGLQSDERFTEAFISSRERQGKGPLRISQELRQKGVAESLVSIYLDENEERWWLLAKDVRLKRFGNELIESPKDKAKQARFLQYRGFSHEQARDAIASVPRHP